MEKRTKGVRKTFAITVTMPVQLMTIIFRPDVAKRLMSKYFEHTAHVGDHLSATELFWSVRVASLQRTSIV